MRSFSDNLSAETNLPAETNFPVETALSPPVPGKKPPQKPQKPQKPQRPQQRLGRESERGSAVLEFIFLATILLIPVSYLILTLGQLQGGAYAVTGAADQAAKVYVSADSLAEAQFTAEQVVAIAVKDYGFEPESAQLTISCSEDPCLTAGSTVTVAIQLEVPLPLLPVLPVGHATVSVVRAESSQVVSRFR
ncbi:hypothetical protein [Psychromicrobium sp. YIM B11713]|uniref:hypothetical protein n=1 Tax=Psychromicrobium sp. YIM B11713 TaxID=3145233 RepID=UPI00374E9193